MPRERHISPSRISFATTRSRETTDIPPPSPTSRIKHIQIRNNALWFIYRYFIRVRERECATPCFMARMNINERVRHRAQPPLPRTAPPASFLHVVCACVYANIYRAKCIATRGNPLPWIFSLSLSLSRSLSLSLCLSRSKSHTDRKLRAEAANIEMSNMLLSVYMYRSTRCYSLYILPIWIWDCFYTKLQKLLIKK